MPLLKVNIEMLALTKKTTIMHISALGDYKITSSMVGHLGHYCVLFQLLQLPKQDQSCDDVRRNHVQVAEEIR